MRSIAPKLVLLGLAVAIGAAVLIIRAGSDNRVKQIRDLVDWDESCAEIAIHDQGHGRWPHTSEAKSVTCEHLGPLFIYLRFGSSADMRADLLQRTPSAATCIVGNEVVIDSLDEGQFERLCRDLDGDIVDRVSRLPELPGGVTIDEIDRYAELGERRDAAAQREALRRYWHDY